MTQQQQLAVQAGDLVAWVDSLGPDDRDEIELPNQPPVILARVGRTQILVKPAYGREGESRGTEAQVHAHPDEATARECHRYNVEANRRTMAEFQIDPEWARLRAQGRQMGVPEQLLDRALPRPNFPNGSGSGSATFGFTG